MTMKTRKTQVPLLLHDVPRKDRDAFRSWGLEQGVTMKTILTTFMRQCVAGKVHPKRNLKLTDKDRRKR